MGYRSDVAYSIRFKKQENFALFLAEAKSHDYGKVALDECNINHERMQINFSAESVKWYESFSDVQAHTALVQQAKDWVDGDRRSYVKEYGDDMHMPETHYLLGFMFVRIGENYDDIEEEFGGLYDPDWIQLNRQLILDWD